MNQELLDFPERFSPNVILRPLFQEILLPNVAFVGGGAEIGYWMELKDIFQRYTIPFPVIILRNSFVIIDTKDAEKLSDLKLDALQLFQDDHLIIDSIINKKNSGMGILDTHKYEIGSIYQKIGELAKSSDVTLEKHVMALRTKALKKIEQLEKKVQRSERKKYHKELQEIQEIKTRLFPNGILQERVNNFCFYAARYGLGFVDVLYNATQPLDLQFCVLVNV